MGSRYRILVRTLLFVTYVPILLAAILVDGNGEVFGLSTENSTALMIFLVVPCAISASLAVILDKAMRIVAVLILLTLLLFLPAL
jgi:hypothetical protein